MKTFHVCTTLLFALMVASAQAECTENYSSMPVETDITATTAVFSVPVADNGYNTAEPETYAGQTTEYTSGFADLTETDNIYKTISSATDQNTVYYSGGLDGGAGDSGYDINSKETSDVDTEMDTDRGPHYETMPSAPTSSPVEDLTYESTASGGYSSGDIPPPPSGYNFKTLSPYSNTSLDAPSIPENRR
ncbi:hypothetical protein COEREDRAFT_79592 [Coemansia reversa NRRL 1564]|uniref:Uncharacterized protein n=1 Tax=Coemansia reversa (strain ATCC 12441 / NRRL 1564) TaxID=763665 RepID=A0A2G5BIE8_COERN|nr:hypothetical protein COEREDRAFT_79592 [Coemansia reversa NRRL 1564]|eukprot:PIA18537.1 hypothetical protein COEREDRAFT_79592 [Coemansia reversa NRRL 1564]